MTDKKVNRICCICGDKAIGKYEIDDLINKNTKNGTNFGAITCESCKAFFRRTAVKNKELKCPFDDNCDINAITRKFCQKCRLKKCLTMGMKKDSILNDRQKQSIRKKIQENKRKRKESSKSNNLLNEWPESTNFIHNSPEIPENGIICKKEIYSDLNSNTYLLDIFKEIDRNYYNSKSKWCELSFESIDRPITDYRNNFNELESNKLTELLNAIHLISESSEGKLSLEITQINQMKALENRFERDVRNLVEFTKKLRAFRELCTEDQIALVKYGCFDFISMRSLLYYDKEGEKWTVIIDKQNSISLKLDIFKYSKRGIYFAFKQFFQKMGSEWDSDHIIVNLLSAILLFNPNLSEITHKDVIKFNQKTYMHLLRRYLLLKYRSDYESESKFKRLLNNLKYAHIMGTVMKSNGSERDDLSPFLNEIFDAKNKTIN